MLETTYNLTFSVGNQRAHGRHDAILLCTVKVLESCLEGSLRKTLNKRKMKMMAERSPVDHHDQAAVSISYSVGGMHGDQSVYHVRHH